MSDPAISYTARSDAAPETEASALANAYRLILDSAMKKAAPASGPEVAKKDTDARTESHST
jgi:hypothetical protein